MAEYIEREAVIDLITRRYENPEICTAEINSIPTADVVERNRGEWIVAKEYNDVIEMNVVKYTCSVCGEYRLSATGLSQATNFCPNCDADMRTDGALC